MTCVQVPAGAFCIDKVVKKRVFVSEAFCHVFSCLQEHLASKTS